VTSFDAVVVGSGPNGLAAAITLAEAGLSVSVIEGADRPGGGCRTGSITLPGFRHDIGSVAHPLIMASPFFRRSAFDDLRRRLLQPEVPFAHPLGGESATAAYRSVDETADGLGPDGAGYRRLMQPLVDHAGEIADAVLAPLRTVPANPVSLARFGLPGFLPVKHLVRRFRGAPAAALLAGAAAHSMAPLTAPVTGAYGLLLTLIAHARGWPVVEGGSAGIVDAMTAELARLGGAVTTGRWIESLEELPGATVVMLDIAPKNLASMAGRSLPAGYARALGRYRYGPGVFKMDWALSGPVPWRAEVCRRAGTVHVGGTLDEIAAGEAAVGAGRHAEHPYCLVVQPGVADATRAPEGRHTLWAYCHVPGGSTTDMTEAIERQIERFAPGFRDLVLARSTTTAVDEERTNPNCVGGNIAGGETTLRQTVFRPTLQWNPYRTPLAGTYLASASTPPGGGVHGMCGVYAARTALHDHFGGPPPFAPR
jgi:phytoene dehydrogenase-like protein